MKLIDLAGYNTITIQCHDNPDADTIGAGYALYCYFKSLGKEVRLVYSGSNQISKTNLKLVIDTLKIPIEYIPLNASKRVEGLLLTVDCQHGAGNVTDLEAEDVAVIDHHPIETTNIAKSRIQPNLGSCATLVWEMLREAGFPVDKDENIGTALYYGLYMDSNQFAEWSNPLDMDMCESVTVNKALMTRYRNANISLQELEIAGLAMIRYNYNNDYRFAVIKSNPCDSNLLGLISDFLLQVVEVDTCVVYNEKPDGFKLSVRSCLQEVNANELAAFLTQDMGSGGGHFEKAGGFISMKLYEEKYPTTHSEAYFNNRMMEYFDSFDIIHAKEVEVNPDEYTLYRRRKDLLCYLKVSDILKPGTKVSLRNQSSTQDIVVEEGTHLIMERDGNIRTMTGEKFQKCMKISDMPVPDDYCSMMEYMPTIKDMDAGISYLLPNYVKTAIPTDAFAIYARELQHGVKIFPKWDDHRYILGVQGDYQVVMEDDLHNMFVEKGNGFTDKFEKI